MKIASVDIGSNTVLLLITKVNLTKKNFSTVLNRYETPRISKHLLDGGSISYESIERLMRVLKRYKTIIDKHGCEHVLINATNAMRIANNSDAIVELIKSGFNYNVKVISGEREAYLSYLGATMDKLRAENIVLDIGGGSTEIILGNETQIYFRTSIKIGAVNLTDKMIKKLPPSNSEINDLKMEIARRFAAITYKFPDSVKLIAVAGTPTTLSCINKNIRVYDEDEVEGSLISTKELELMIGKLSFMSAEDIKEKYGQVVEGREDVLLTGAIILRTFCDFISVDKLRVSGKGLRYGAVVDYLNTHL